MKTSVIEVHDMLSVLSVDEVEKRIGEVPGVGSVTVNYAAGSATVRYDETRLEIADIRSAVRQRGYESAVAGSHEGHAARGAPPATPAPATAYTAPVAAATAAAASADAAQLDKKAPTAAPSAPVAATPKPAPAALAAAPAAPPGEGHEGHVAPDKK